MKKRVSTAGARWGALKAAAFLFDLFRALPVLVWRRPKLPFKLPAQQKDPGRCQGPY